MAGRGRGLGVALLLLAIIAGCSSTPPPPASAPAGGTSPPAASDCRTKIEAVDFAKPETIDAADRCRFTAAGAESARAVMASGAKSSALWAAVWVYAASGTDPAPLRPILANDDPSIRAMAAASLVSFGDASGFAVLRDVLDEDGQLLGSSPPISVGSFAVLTLTGLVDTSGAPAAPDSEIELASAQTSWADWLAAHESSLVFDPTAGTWSAK